jgi:DNA-binding winged helix-turn-helix (wHTH) protein
MRARFGDFVVDFETRQLLRVASPIHLTPKAYQLLTLLVEAQPRALSKDELQKALWPSTFVDEANLTVIVAELRAALGDDARQPRFVRTVHGFGYAFAAEVVEERRGEAEFRSSGAWWLYAPGLQIKLQAGENVVGREPPVEVWLDSGSVSRRHARVVVDRQRTSLEDLDSKNGTWVNGRRVEGLVDIADGDELRFGSVVVHLRWAEAAASTETFGPLADS